MDVHCMLATSRKQVKKKNNCILQAKEKFQERKRGNQCSMCQVTDYEIFLCLQEELFLLLLHRNDVWWA